MSIFSRPYSDLTDREGILAFAMRREGHSDMVIGIRLWKGEGSVRTYFDRYPVFQPWSRALRVPEDLTPDVIEELSVRAA